MLLEVNFYVYHQEWSKHKGEMYNQLQKPALLINK